MDRSLATYIVYSIALGAIIVLTIFAMMMRYVTKSIAPTAVVVIITSILGIGYFSAMLAWIIMTRLTSDGSIGTTDIMVTTTAGLGVIANTAFAGYMISRLRSGPNVSWGASMLLWAGANAALLGTLIPMMLHSETEQDEPTDSFVVLKGYRNMAPVQGNGVSMGERSSKGGSDMTVSMYLALDPRMMMQLNATAPAASLQRLPASSPLLAKIPLFLIGLNKKYYDADGKDVAVRSPVIYMVIERGKSPYFEVDFNHLESTDSDPSRGALAEQNACFLVNKYTARCRFVRDSALVEGEHTLMKYWDKGYGRTAEELETSRRDSDAYCHSIVFVFSERMMPVSAASKKSVFTTTITVYVNKQVHQTLHFPGQMNMSSTTVMPLPSNLFVRGTGVSDAVLRGLLNASYLADVRIYKRALSEAEATSPSRMKKQLNKFPITTSTSLTVASEPIADEDADVNNDVYVDPGIIANSFRVTSLS
jgi:hypothetical protein